ncbi:S-layer homology domain-containing protein [Lysinibacillus sp. TE18511]
MANQPKKYKKFVATAATATLVASAIVPVASAAGFTDVANNTHKDAINALADAGIINGYSDGTFRPDTTINRGQVVKLLGRWLETEGFEAPADWDTKQRFNDLPLTAEKELVKYAALAKDAGVFAGSNGNLNHTQTMQRQQMAVVLVRAINEIYELDLVKEYKAAKFTSEISDLDKAFSAEQREAITALEYAELTNAATLPGKAFNPANSITRGQFASFLYRTINLEVPNNAKASVKAINNTTVEVTFDKEVDDVQALKFEIKDLEVKNAAVKQTNKKVVVLTTAPQTADKEYTVSSNGEEIGKFKGVNAVIPTKVDLVEKSTQGKLGQQVTLKAQVTVAEGQNKAGIPVTFFIPGSANGVKAPVTVEALTNEEGIATYTYTRYAATEDTVTAYATGDRSKFSTGYVFWAVDQTLTITEVTTGDTINNGANKTYKVTYKHPETGKPVSGVTLNVAAKENIDVTADKLQNVTINGKNVAQLSNGQIVEAAQITTDSKGEATFTVSGSNAEATPVVYVAEKSSTNSNQFEKKYTADKLQASAKKVTFSAQQAAYALEVTRDGGEVAATGFKNGRKYNVVVKDKDGKLAANETVNVALNEDVDGVIATNTNAKFVKLEDGKQVAYDGKQISVKTNSKGEASFIIGNDDINSYATPVVWIDINTPNAKEAKLDKGEPNAVAPISYFQAEYLDGAKLVVKDANGKEKSDFDASAPAIFEAELVNQSGKVMSTSYTLHDVNYTIFNTGENDVKVGDQVISPNRSYTVQPTSGKLSVTSVDGKSTAVKVVATGIAKQSNSKDFAFTAKEATAKFTATKEVPNSYTGTVKYYNTPDEGKDSNSIWFDGKDPVKYADVTGKKFKYFGANGNEVYGEEAFEKLLAQYEAKNAAITVSYTVDGDTITFKVITVQEGSADAIKKYVPATNPAENKAPVAKDIPAKTVAANGTDLKLTVSELATDADGDKLEILTATSTNAAVATATVATDKASITVSPKTTGKTTISAIVTDGKAVTTVNFDVNVTSKEFFSIIGNPAVDYSETPASAASLVLTPGTNLAGNIGLTLTKGTDVATTTVALPANATAAQIAKAITDQVATDGTKIKAEVVSDTVKVSSTETGAVTIANPGTLAGVTADKIVDGKELTKNPAKFSFKVANDIEVGKTVTVKVGTETYTYTTVAADATADTLATNIVAAINATATAKYTASVTGTDVVVLTQKAGNEAPTAGAKLTVTNN